MEEGEIQSILPGALHVPQPVGPEGLAGLQDTAEEEPAADEVVILEPGQGTGPEVHQGDFQPERQVPFCSFSVSRGRLGYRTLP